MIETRFDRDESFGAKRSINFNFRGSFGLHSRSLEMSLRDQSFGSLIFDKPPHLSASPRELLDHGSSAKSAILGVCMDTVQLGRNAQLPSN
jgi:hypothetical protein